ncbi:MAG TPA: hypothetical protein DCP71_03365 [Verrucomicrobiales bacterium]|nr:hypothetical protein [Verrucomicrobiales bacterium]
MPAKEHLHRRGNTFYFSMRLPRSLKKAGAEVMVNGKAQKTEVKFPFNTSDYREAVGLVPPIRPYGRLNWRNEERSFEPKRDSNTRTD